MAGPTSPRSRPRLSVERVQVDLEPGEPGQGRQSGGGQAVLDGRHAGSAGAAPGAGASTGRGANPRRALARLAGGDGREALARDRETVGQVRGQDAGVAESLAGGVAGQAVQVDAEPGRIERGESLGEERADRPGQDVAGPAAREGRVLERCDGDLAIGGRDDGPGALQHDTLAPGGRGIAHGGDPGVVVIGQVAVLRRVEATPRAQPGELAGVRREDGRSPIAVPPVVHRRERPERFGIEQDRRLVGSSATMSRRTSSAVARPGRSPGPMTMASCSWSRIRAYDGSGSSSSTSSSGRAIVVASTTFAAKIGCSDSGTARVTSPAPVRPAARATSRAAPA